MLELRNSLIYKSANAQFFSHYESANKLPRTCKRNIDRYREPQQRFLTVVVPSNEVGTAFANEIMSTIPADDRCRKFAGYIVDH